MMPSKSQVITIAMAVAAMAVINRIPAAKEVVNPSGTSGKFLGLF